MKWRCFILGHKEANTGVIAEGDGFTLCRIACARCDGFIREELTERPIYTLLVTGSLIVERKDSEAAGA